MAFHGQQHLLTAGADRYQLQGLLVQHIAIVENVRRAGAGRKQARSNDDGDGGFAQKFGFFPPDFCLLTCVSPTAIMNGTFRHCVSYRFCTHDYVNPGQEFPVSPWNATCFRRRLPFASAFPLLFQHDDERD